MSDNVEEINPTATQLPGQHPRRCSICEKTFSRLEHLKRHALVHDKTRQFECGTCHKSFVRRDTLQRHETVHQQTPSPQAKCTRACSACVVAKTRCSGGIPCCRCSAREQPCTYPTSATPAGNSERYSQQSIDLVSTKDPHTDNRGMRDTERTSPSGNFDTAMEGGIASVAAAPWNGQNHFALLGAEPGSRELSQQEPSYGGAALQTPQYQAGPFDSIDPNYWMTGASSTINWLMDDYSALDFDYGSTSGGTTHDYWPDIGAFQLNTLQTQPHEDLTSPIGHDSLADLDAPGVSSTSPASLSVTDQPSVPGEFYVDGAAARLPRVKRRKLNPVRVTPKTASFAAASFSLAYEWPATGRGASQEYFSDEDYDCLLSAFKSLCLDVKGSSASTTQNHGITPIYGNVDHGNPPLPSSHLAFTPDTPPKSFFDELVKLYFDNFHPLLPILHVSPSDPRKWETLLAAGALGSHYLQGSDSLTISLHEFTRRVLQSLEEVAISSSHRSIELYQMKLLHCIGCLYSGDERLHSHGSKLRLDSANSCPDILEHSEVADSRDIESRWTDWRRDESQRRLSYSIWLLDTMSKVHFGQRPIPNSESTRLRLPAHEQVWAAATAREWAEVSRRYSPAPTLANALEQLYIDKKLLSDLGEFSRILLIHGIFRWTWEIEAYLEEPLSHWTPTAEKRSPEEARSRSLTWLPSVSTYARWRNSACDCLDILHWSANATIGLQSGLEHPTVMHLHFARVVLLSPYKNIVRFAEHLSGESRSSSGESIVMDKQMIRRWVNLDQYKARLAMIHAGVLFWHIRRFSANGFYEPSSVGLTALALWAFSAFSTSSKESEPSSHSGRDEFTGIDQRTDETEEAVCDIILIDRPTDDELVQQFVRRGNTMKPIMNGVGDLYGPRAPEKVLIEGRRLLATSSTWGVRDRWIRILDKLASVSRQRQIRTQG
ncbi:hypothetical protein ABEF95_015245 [Exophiala dermatitidis]